MAASLNDPSIQARLVRIKLFIFDIDGVLTDGKAYYSSEGLALKAFSMHDGFGFVMARFAGLELGALTGDPTGPSRKRLEKFNITNIKGGHFRKTGYFEEMIEEAGIEADEALYMGDDLFDIPVLRLAGVSVAPADARPQVLDMVDAVTSKGGGEGAVREVIEAIVTAQGKWDQVLAEIENDEKGGR